MDTVSLTGLSFYGYHGAHAEERVLGQRFVVDLRLSLDLTAAATTDDVSDTVHYGHVWELVRDVVEGEPVALVERLGGRIASNLLDRFPRVQQVWIRVEKPSAPIAGWTTGRVSIELTRDRTPGNSRSSNG